MATQRFPELDPTAIVDTRNALHAYAQILGSWLWPDLAWILVHQFSVGTALPLVSGYGGD